MVGSAVQDYLKSIYKLKDSDGLTSPSSVAERLEVSAAAVSKMMKRLTDLNLVQTGQNHRIGLTPAGEKIALEVIRHHRLLELYLTEALGYTWDQVDHEAEKLEHVISEEFEDRIDELLGFPTHDPHGDPIPSRNGDIEPPHQLALGALEPGQFATVRRVSDADPAMLRYLGQMGLYPRTAVQMLQKEPFGGPLTVRVADTERAIGRELAAHVFVSRDEAPREVAA